MMQSGDSAGLNLQGLWSSSYCIRLLQVTSMARQMVVNYGFSDIGPWSLQDPSAQSGDMIMRMMARNSISESLQKRIDDAVRCFIQTES